FAELKELAEPPHAVRTRQVASVVEIGFTAKIVIQNTLRLHKTYRNTDALQSLLHALPLDLCSQSA
ncbi:MAG: hypothetical protein ACPGUX_11830, partial [Halocynthiibacter sp.]